MFFTLSGISVSGFPHMCSLYSRYGKGQYVNYELCSSVAHQSLWLQGHQLNHCTLIISLVGRNNCNSIGQITNPATIYS